jgi:predicted RND superfamily exporter protein
MLAAGIAFTLGCGILIPSLEIDQRFNEELPATHPVTRSQQMLERNFGGFLGPEVSIRRRDGGSMLDGDSRQRLDRFVRELQRLPDTHHVWSIADLLPPPEQTVEADLVLDRLREMPEIRQRLRELISVHNDRLAVIVRIGDVGTERAADYRDEILTLGKTSWGDAYELEIVGQWWLAQHGMRLLLRDMLTSLGTAMIIVLPLMWVALRDLRLFIAASLANLLPLLLPLAFMAAAGISLRIGTAVVLALALGIVVDNTLHVIIRLRAGLRKQGRIATDLPGVMQGTGRAVVFTTLALIGGFLSMLGNDLLAIRDMGLVAAVTIFGAMLADLLLLPAVYVVLCREGARSESSLPRSLES